MPIYTLPCPVDGCPLTVTAHVRMVGDDWVPYGSTMIRLPGGYDVEFDGLHLGHTHPPLSVEEYDALEQDALALADQAEEEPEEPEDAEPDTEGYDWSYTE